jgi:RNA polymerase sigma-70 factor (ECF subfamily)
MPSKKTIYYEYLVFRCRHHDRQAWRELVRLFEDRLFYYIRQIIVDEHDSLNTLQETWIRVFRSIHQIKDPARLPAWLFHIARNAALACLKKRCIFISYDDGFISDDSVKESHDLLHGISAEQVHLALGKLPLQHREVLLLFFLENLSIKESADILCIPEGTVRSRLHYAKKALKTLLEKEIET